MTPKDSPSIVVGYYDPKHHPLKQSGWTSEQKQRAKYKWIAQRCSGEIISLCNQLGTIMDQLSLALRRKDVDDVVHLCQFHHENYLFRTYSLRERAWDVLAALVEVPRKNTGNESFRNSVLSKIKAVYPEIYEMCSELHRLIHYDVRTRNVATHKTFLILYLTFGDDFRNTYEIDTVLTSCDPRTEDGIRIQSMVRKALREFVAEDKKHIEEIITIAFEFVQHCYDAIDKKRW